MYENLVNPKPAEPDRLAEAYFQTFAGPYGQIVLTHLMAELHVFDEVLNEDEVTLSNFGKRLLGFIGVINEDNMKDIVKFYISLARRKVEAELQNQNIQTKEG